MKFNSRQSIWKVTTLMMSLALTGCRDTSVVSRVLATKVVSPSQNTALPTGDNVMAVTVNGSLCDPNNQYPNEPCTSVTLCQHGTSNCQTINNILLDSGSYGLRIFSTVITVPTVTITKNAGSVATCANFGDSASLWGTVDRVDVKLANEPAVLMPIQVVKPTYATPPPNCSSAQSTPLLSPQNAGFNGIMGVGSLFHDCGAACTTLAKNLIYYTCVGTVCTGSTMELVNQVQNPVSLLPIDNNGMVLTFGPVPTVGAISVNGTMTLGIGTRTNNIPKGGTTLAADATDGYISTIFPAYSATAISAILDTGSNYLYFPTPTNTSTLPDCSSAQGGNISTDAGYFCPSTSVTLTTTILSSNNKASISNSFQVASFNAQYNSGNSVFMNIAKATAATAGPATFDWGLPFFFGKTVYMGIENTPSSLGTGPYWAF
jgi:hypothetical protein